MADFQLSVPLKSAGTTYLLWAFLGLLGGHKFYLGKPFVGIIYALSLGLLGVGILWDLFFIPSQVRSVNRKIAAEAQRLYGRRDQVTASTSAGLIAPPR